MLEAHCQAVACPWIWCPRCKQVSGNAPGGPRSIEGTLRRERFLPGVVLVGAFYATLPLAAAAVLCCLIICCAVLAYNK
jgi:hypothetical protein